MCALFYFTSVLYFFSSSKPLSLSSASIGFNSTHTLLSWSRPVWLWRKLNSRSWLWRIMDLEWGLLHTFTQSFELKSAFLSTLSLITMTMKLVMTVTVFEQHLRPSSSAKVRWPFCQTSPQGGGQLNYVKIQNWKIQTFHSNNISTIKVEHFQRWITFCFGLIWKPFLKWGSHNFWLLGESYEIVQINPNAPSSATNCFVNNWWRAFGNQRTDFVLEYFCIAHNLNFGCTHPLLYNSHVFASRATWRWNHGYISGLSSVQTYILSILEKLCRICQNWNCEKKRLNWNNFRRQDLAPPRQWKLNCKAKVCCFHQPVDSAPGCWCGCIQHILHPLLG